MKLVHMQSRRGRRGRKLFPGMDTRYAMPMGNVAGALIAALLAAGRKK
jgi:hypothetical protein